MHPSSVLARNLFRRVLNEIHDIWRGLKSCTIKYFKWLLKCNVIKGQRAKGWQRVGKGYILFQTRSQRAHWNLEAQRAQCTSVEA